MDDRTQSTLLVRLKDRGDAAAWGTFEELYRPLIVSFAVSRGLDGADAEDVAQQCTQAVLEKIGDYQHLASFKAWLRAIAEHKIVDQHRKHGRQVQGGSSFWSGQADKGGEEPPDAWDRQWVHAHIVFCAEKVRALVNESTYEAFSACVVRGIEPAAVAASLNLSVNQVYVAKHRVLERIRGMLHELHGQDGVL